jgi:hypothetical protein
MSNASRPRTCPTLRDWVHRYNADGLAGLADATLKTYAARLEAQLDELTAPANGCGGRERALRPCVIFVKARCKKNQRTRLELPLQFDRVAAQRVLSV